MTKIEWEGFTIRCWREERNYSKEIEQKTHDEIAHTLEMLEVARTKLRMKDPKYVFPRVLIATELLKLARMNAVEVLDTTSHGLVIYKDWP
jgi:hypothetical protein